MKHQVLHDDVTKLCSHLTQVKPEDTLHCSFRADDECHARPVALQSMQQMIAEGKYTKVSSVSVKEVDDLIIISVQVR